MKPRNTLIAAALTSTALVLSGTAYAQLGATGQATGQATGAAGATIPGAANGTMNTGAGLGTAAGATGNGAVGATTNGAAQAGGGLNTATDATTNGAARAGAGLGTAAGATANSAINAGAGLGTASDVQTTGGAGVQAGTNVGINAGTNSNMNANANAHSGVGINGGAASNGALTAKAGANDVTSRMASSLNGRTVVDKRGKVLGTIENVSSDAHGMSKVYLHTASSTGLHGKTVALPAAMFSGQASAAARNNGRLKAATISRADLREMPSANAAAKANAKSNL